LGLLALYPSVGIELAIGSEFAIVGGVPVLVQVHVWENESISYEARTVFPGRSHFILDTEHVTEKHDYTKKNKCLSGIDAPCLGRREGRKAGDLEGRFFTRTNQAREIKRRASDPERLRQGSRIDSVVVYSAEHVGIGAANILDVERDNWCFIGCDFSIKRPISVSVPKIGPLFEHVGFVAKLQCVMDRVPLQGQNTYGYYSDDTASPIGNSLIGFILICFGLGTAAYGSTYQRGEEYETKQYIIECITRFVLIVKGRLIFLQGGHPVVWTLGTLNLF
jgi:hypothetical protein